MSTKKSASKDRAGKPGGGVSKAAAGKPTPNDLPNPVTAEHEQALQVTCQFLGKTYYEGDTICYQNEEWVCGVGGWSKTGNAC